MMFLLVAFFSVAGPAGNKIELPIVLQPGTVFISPADCAKAIDKIKKAVPQGGAKLGCIRVFVNGGPKAEAF